MFGYMAVRVPKMLWRRMCIHRGLRPVVVEEQKDPSLVPGQIHLYESCKTHRLGLFASVRTIELSPTRERGVAETSFVRLTRSYELGRARKEFGSQDIESSSDREETVDPSGSRFQIR